MFENQNSSYEIKRLAEDIVNYLVPQRNTDDVEGNEGTVAYNILQLTQILSKEELKDFVSNIIPHLNSEELKEILNNNLTASDIQYISGNEPLMDYGIEDNNNGHEKPTRQSIIDEAKMASEAIINNPINYRGKDNLYVDYDVDYGRGCVIALLKEEDTEKILKSRKTACHPGYSFNIHIGKAIATYRLFNMKVPSIFTNVPLPTEIEVGDIVEYYGDLPDLKGTWTVAPNHHMTNKAKRYIRKDEVCTDSFIIIDDSNR